MNERVIALLQFYDQTLAARGIPPLNLSDSLCPIGDQRLAHVRWMLGQMLVPTEPRLAEKFLKERTVNRWLGFCQGVFYCSNIFTIKEMRDQSRDLYSGE
jgi:hypothetical protein